MIQSKRHHRHHQQQLQQSHHAAAPPACICSMPIAASRSLRLSVHCSPPAAPAVPGGDTSGDASCRMLCRRSKAPSGVEGRPRRPLGRLLRLTVAAAFPKSTSMGWIKADSRPRSSSTCSRGQIDQQQRLGSWGVVGWAVPLVGGRRRTAAVPAAAAGRRPGPRPECADRRGERDHPRPRRHSSASLGGARGRSLGELIAGSPGLKVALELQERRSRVVFKRKTRTGSILDRQVEGQAPPPGGGQWSSVSWSVSCTCWPCKPHAGSLSKSLRLMVGSDAFTLQWSKQPGSRRAAPAAATQSSGATKIGGKNQQLKSRAGKNEMAARGAVGRMERGPTCQQRCAAACQHRAAGQHKGWRSKNTERRGRRGPQQLR